MSTQNNYAVFAQRTESKITTPDDFPTPPWATRGLMEHVLVPNYGPFDQQTCLEPACGRGYMSRTLAEYFGEIESSDAYDYGYRPTTDYLEMNYAVDQFDWVVTNPPFKLAQAFIEKSLRVARRGVAILARTTFIESVGRYEGLFRDNPPTIFAQYVERVPMVQGRLDRKASTATGYAWLVWHRMSISTSINTQTRLMWIPPCRKTLERDSDYEAATNETESRSDAADNSRLQLDPTYGAA